MPKKARQRYLRDKINNKTYQLTVLPHLAGWWVVVTVVGQDMSWPRQIDNLTLDDAKEWAIKKALIDAYGSQFEEVYPLAGALAESWTEIDLPA